MAEAFCPVYDERMTGRSFTPFLRSRPHALASFTNWRALQHGLEAAHDGMPRRTLLWHDIREVRLAVERDRRDRRRRCDIITRAGDWFTIYGPAPGRLLDMSPEGDYAALVREIVARARKANPQCRLVHGRFIGRMVTFHAIVFAAFVIFVEIIGRFSGMKSEDPSGFAWLQFGSIGVLALWSTLAILGSTPRPLDPDDIPAALLAP
ncbi:MAG: hypothetical protein ACK4MV_13550 [Beijerinckiaceae bacterium]